jgi:hypothetical protein
MRMLFLTLALAVSGSMFAATLWAGDDAKTVTKCCCHDGTDACAAACKGHCSPKTDDGKGCCTDACKDKCAKTCQAPTTQPAAKADDKCGDCCQAKKS